MTQDHSKQQSNPIAGRDDYDTPWKDALVEFFEQFMAFFFPDAHAQIDWTRREAFLDTELSEVAPDAVIGKLFVDKLIQVYLINGGVDWICIHIEVQGRRQAKFAERMYIYCSRIFHRFGRSVASMAVLADNNLKWLPNHFSYSLLGCELSLKFPIAKLTDHGDDIDALLANPNPFALLTAAQLLNQRTKGDKASRLAKKIHLTRMLYQHDWEEKRIISLFRVIDWMMRLPKELDKTFQTTLRTLKEERKMQYVTSIERLAAEEARKEVRKETRKEVNEVRKEARVEVNEVRKEAREEVNEVRKEARVEVKEVRQKVSTDLLSHFLTARFGAMPAAAAERVSKASLNQVKIWLERAASATTLDDVFRKVAR